MARQADRPEEGRYAFRGRDGHLSSAGSGGDGSRSGGYSEFVELWTAARALGWWDGGVAILRGVGVPLFVGAAPYAIGGTALCYCWALKVVRRRQQRLRAAPVETIPA